MTELIPDQEGFTELVDPSVPRVDLVDVPANGAPGWLLMKQDAQAGLMSPQTIRDLIGKTAKPIPQEETVTMTGSPGAIAKLMHEAALRAANRDYVEKAEKSTKAINDLPDSDFAYIEPGGKKDDEGKTVPRSLRHFPIMDAAHTRNALSRAPQSPFGDKAMPKIRAAAKKFDIDVAKAIGGDLDGDVDMNELDATIVLAEPDDDMDAPGNANEPGSPAWEAIDAATARKWTSIAVRLRNALCVMAEREMLEAATADPDDAMAAWDLKDAECALDYVIDTLAGFAVEEQTEAELAAEMEAVGKAMHSLDIGALDTFEALAPITKAGRVLSSANEAAIRAAADSLQKVLASLPAAPIEKSSGPEVAKTANEEPNMPSPTPSEDATAASGQEPAMGAKSPEPKPVAGVPVTDMAKADGDKPKMMAVFNAKGKLIGIVDPTKITPIDGADGDDGPEDDGEDDGADETADDGAPQTTDLTPEPPAEAGTPADAVPTDDEAVTKTTNDTDQSDMFKSSLLAAVESAFKEHSASQNTVLVKQADAVLELAELVETLKGRIGALEEQPAAPKVFTNGAAPSRDLRGMDRGATPVDMGRAADLRKQLYAPVAADQNAAATELQQMAIDRLQAIHQQRR